MANDPIFLLGNHRSGTTWLYQLLAATGRFGVLTAFHVVEWPRIAAARMTALGVRTREVDRVEVTPDLPEEYGYILANAGYPSWLRPRGLPLPEQVIDVVARFAPGRPVLLKNPWDSGNLRTVARLFLQAPYVFSIATRCGWCTRT